jgi:hypothetical protein
VAQCSLRRRWATARFLISYPRQVSGLLAGSGRLRRLPDNGPHSRPTINDKEVAMSVNLHALVRRLRRLADAGIPPEPLAETVALWQTEKGRLLHGSDRCGRVSKRFPYRTRVDLMATDASKLCVSCAVDLTGTRLEPYLVHAEMLLTAREWTDGLGSLRLTVAHIVELRAYQRRIKEIVPSARPELVPLLDEFLHRLDQILTTGSLHELAQRERNLLIQRCWRDSVETWRPHGHDVLPPFGTVDLSPVTGGEKYTQYAPVRKAWTAWGSAINDDADSATARRAAIAAGVAAAGAAPKTLDHVPDKPRFAGAMFATPQEWATAEWVAARDEMFEALVQHWEQGVAAALDAAETDQVAVSLRIQETNYTLRPKLDAVLSAYTTVSAEGTYLFAAPRLVARWLISAIADAVSTSKHLQRMIYAEMLGPSDTDTDAVYDTALTLWTEDPANRPLSEHLSTARLCCA